MYSYFSFRRILCVDRWFCKSLLYFPKCRNVFNQTKREHSSSLFLSYQNSIKRHHISLVLHNCFCVENVSPKEEKCAMTINLMHKSLKLECDCGPNMSTECIRTENAKKVHFISGNFEIFWNLSFEDRWLAKITNHKCSFTLAEPICQKPFA